jgi:MSHA pilin protein MshD
MYKVPFKIPPGGFTFVELIISILIISVSVIGILMAMNVSIRYSGDPAISEQAIAIAESYLQEISEKSFPIIPCPTPTGGRGTYTNICNYYSFPTAAPADQTGAAIPALSNYTVAVNIDTTAAQLGTLTTGTQVVRIDVTVSHNAMPTMTFSAYRTNYQ